MRRVLLAVGIGAVVVAAGVVTAVAVSSGEEPDPNEATVVKMCRDAAVEEPVMTEGVQDFTLSELTLEVEDGAAFYRASGSATTSDGYGGQKRYTFDCQAKLDGKRWDLIDITLL